jgi:tetratricopeptide (TPR) repeat protein
MRSHQLPIAVLGILFALCPPSSAQVSSATGNQGTYEPRGPDYGYDNMKADTNAGTAVHDELAAGAALVKQQKYGEAIPHLELAARKRRSDPSASIYLGFAHRMLAATLSGEQQAAEFGKALDSYKQALAIDADNKLLHEYLGKLYLLTREYAKASDELTTLERLCPSGCSEREALMQAVAANPPPPNAAASKP